jgi:hypothetical protein
MNSNRNQLLKHADSRLHVQVPVTGLDIHHRQQQCVN